MERIFAIGDIHGCARTFETLLINQLQIQKSDSIYCIGDYIDRGKKSKEVIDFILGLKDEGYQIYTIRGNHEQMLLDSFNNEEASDLWLKNGGKTTMKSFGIQSIVDLTEKYLSFFTDTEFYILKDDYIFVHAGLNFENENIFEDREAMLWIRSFDTQQPALGNNILIHGHTPESLNVILNQNSNCVNIDGGCVYNKHKHLGNLVALDVKERKYISISHCE